MTELLNVDEALNRILVDFQQLPSELVPLESSLHRVLAVDIVAEVSIPPFPNSSMDGYAVRAADSQRFDGKNPVLRVVMDIPAGSAPNGRIESGQAARIMTGAMMPDGADAVIPVEQTDSTWQAGDYVPLPETVTLRAEIKPGNAVRPIGEDIRIGDTVLRAGNLIRPQEMGVLAALGQANVPVIRQPRVAILSSGDELVSVDQPLAPGKIRDTNSYTLAGLIQSYGGIPYRIPTARDQMDDIRRRFQEALDLHPDLIISSAGVSVGTLDMMRAVMMEYGDLTFWRVNLRPGKPLAYGKLRGIPYFGLPGNPVSAMVTFDVFVRPALLKLGGQADAFQTIIAVLSEELHSDGRRSYIRVKLHKEQDQWVARTTGTQSSGALTSMVQADGLLILPEGVTLAAPGDQFPVRLLKSTLLNDDSQR